MAIDRDKRERLRERDCYKQCQRERERKRKRELVTVFNTFWKLAFFPYFLRLGVHCL